MKRYFFLSTTEWAKAFAVSITAASITAWQTAWISPWISISVGICALCVMHMSRSTRAILSLPHIAILLAGLQYVFAAWLNFYWPPTNPAYDIGSNLTGYLSYAGPVLAALAVGWFLPVAGSRSHEQQVQQPERGILFELDLLLGAGIAGLLLNRIVDVPGLGFVWVLLGNLRYVAVYGRMIVKGPGWIWRLTLVLVAEVLFATEKAMFYDLLMWLLWTFAIWIYGFKPKPRTVVACLAIAVLMLPALQESKWELRKAPLREIELGQGEIAYLDETPIGQMKSWLGYLGSSLYRTVTFELDSEFIADIAVRYNQGWIVNRVMATVPETEPFADGTTLKDAVIAAFLPRLVYAEKDVAGGHDKMLRYAGMELGESTSMNLGLAGEMYANFGYWGGIIGCGIFAAFFGLLFRLIANRAITRPLWWSIVPFVFYAVTRAEDDVTFILNWATKGSIIFAGVLVFLPHFRRALFGREKLVPASAVTDVRSIAQ